MITSTLRAKCYSGRLKRFMTSHVASFEDKPFSEIPGPTIWPLVGSLPDFLHTRRGNLPRAHFDYYTLFGPIVKQKLRGEEELIIYNPHEALKIYRQEGPFPYSVATELWPTSKWYQQNRVPSDLMQSGQVWKDHRMKIQPDIFSPQAAASYLCYFRPVVKDSSSLFEDYANQPGGFKTFSVRATFDMFCAAIIGRSLGTLKPDADPRDVKYLTDTSTAMEYFGKLIFSPLEAIQSSYRETPTWRAYDTAMKAGYARSAEIAAAVQEDSTLEGFGVDSKDSQQDFEELWEGRVMGEAKASGSYLERLKRRGQLSEVDISHLIQGLLFAGVETTSVAFMWLLFNLARNPAAQTTLRKELREVLQGSGYEGKLGANYLPYLRACYRESHRLTPVGLGSFRRLSTHIVVNGFKVPARTKLALNTNAIQNDPKFVENPEVFKPDRWLPEAVERRKGTQQEILDHKLLSTPFSFGPRMCLGGRLAEMEILSLTAQVIQDWELELAPDCPDVRSVQRLTIQPEPTPKILVKRA